MQLTPDLIAMALAGLLTGGLAIRLWPLRAQTSVPPLLLALSSASFWAFDVVVEFSLRNFWWKHLLVMAKPFAVLGLVSSLVILAVEYTGRFKFIGRRNYTLLLVVPVITLALSFLPEQYGLYRYNFRLRPHGNLFAMTWDEGPWQEVVHDYGYLLSGAAFVAFFYTALFAKRGYRRIMLLTASSWLAPFAGDLTSKLGITSQETDLTAWGMFFAALVTAWALVVERMFNVGPIARSLVVERLGDLLFVLDAERNLVDCSARAAEALGRPTSVRWRSIRPETLAEPWPAILTPQGTTSDHVTLGDAGKVRIYERIELPLFDRRDRQVGWSILLHDISHLEAMRETIVGKNAELSAANESLRKEIEQRLATEARLLEAARMETVGRLAGGVAHDFNNLLTVINGYAGLLQRGIDAGNPDRNHVEQIRKAGARAADLTRQLLTFSRKQAIQPCYLNLNAAVQETRQMLKVALPENIELILELDPALGNIHADPGQIHQVLMNMAVNARDAMPHGGKLIIGTANVDPESEDSQQRTEMPAGPLVKLMVSDTGIGMSEKVRARIFEPFFTTKATGQGIGMGLAIVYGIVGQSGGRIQVHSEPGKGTSFRAYFPRHYVSANHDEAAAAPVAPGGNETVLVVEDEDGVRGLVREVLQDHGYRVLEASSGPAAIAVAGQFGAPIQLLLTDIVMPGMTGHELAGLLSSRRPEMKVLYMSGYAESVISHEKPLNAGIAHIQKPMTPDDLAARVREILGPAAD